MCIADLKGVGAVEAERTSDQPHESLRPVGSPDIGETKLDRHREVE